MYSGHSDSSAPTWPIHPAQPGPYPPQRPRRRRRWLWLLLGIPALCALCVCAVAAVAAISPEPRGFVTGDDNGAVYIAWSEQSGAMTGTGQLAWVDTSGSKPAFHMFKADFTGTHEGSQITIVIHWLLGVTYTLHGTLASVSLLPGGVNEYNAAVQRVRNAHPNASGVLWPVPLGSRVEPAYSKTQKGETGRQ